MSTDRAGCQTPLHVLERILRDTDAHAVFLELMRGEPGNEVSERDDSGRYKPKCDDVTQWESVPDTIPIPPNRKPATGNSTTYSLRQLERGRKVRGGEPIAFGLGYRPEDIDHIIGERREKQAAEGAIQATPLLKDEELKAARIEGGSLGGRGNKKPSLLSNEGLQGNSSDYLTARIARDRPDILDRMKAGELSIHRAMLEAGFRKPSVTLPVEPTAGAGL